MNKIINLKTKLHDARIRRGHSQEQLAKLAAMSQPKYSRKESGYSPILEDEWNLLAKVLDVPLEEIYEEDVAKTYIYKNVKGNSFNSGTININVPDFVMNYIQLLEKKVVHLEDELQKLKEISNPNS